MSTCCMCINQILGEPFISQKCLIEHRKDKAHKICAECWWNKFAIEDRGHKCPGCTAKMDLCMVTNEKIFIDLTKE